MDELTEAFAEHVRLLVARGESGDEVAIKSLACMALLREGWEPGDGPGGGEVIDLVAYRERLAA